MSKTIQQSVTFSASARELYTIYMDSRKHATAIGGPVSISKKAGGGFSAFGGRILGRNLLLAPGRLIVQSWRGSDWKKADLDSILVLTFSDTVRGGRIDLVHANVPESASPNIRAGWTKYYWTAWRAYLRKAGRR